MDGVGWLLSNSQSLTLCTDVVGQLVFRKIFLAQQIMHYDPLQAFFCQAK